MSSSKGELVDEVAVPGTTGRIGMALFPGRCDDLNDNHWRRDLALDLEAIRRLDPSLLVTLNEPHEFEILGVPDFEKTLERSGLPWRHLPIPDGGVPGPDFERARQHVGREAREALRAGGLIVIHCRAGLCPTDTIAARLLVGLGTSPQAAIAAVRKARGPTMIETRAQERHVLSTRPIKNPDA
ncbi:MAG: hypothetical protein ACLPYS_06635 [Vulcanimicrobiaceae bacterium]